MQQTANFILCGFVENLRFCAEMQWSVEYCNQKKNYVQEFGGSLNSAALCGRIVAKAGSAPNGSAKTALDCDGRREGMPRRERSTPAMHVCD